MNVSITTVASDDSISASGALSVRTVLQMTIRYNKKINIGENKAYFCNWLLYAECALSSIECM